MHVKIHRKGQDFYFTQKLISVETGREDGEGYRFSGLPDSSRDSTPTADAYVEGRTQFFCETPQNAKYLIHLEDEDKSLLSVYTDGDVYIENANGTTIRRYKA